MKVLFKSELLEQMSSKFVIEFYNYCEDKDLNEVSLKSLKVDEVDDLNQVTTIEFVNFDGVVNSYYCLVVKHAKNMSCANWQFKRVVFDGPLKKGESFTYMGYTIKMCSNDDGIALLSPDGRHLGNFGNNHELAKRYALAYYAINNEELQASIVARLLSEDRQGLYHDWFTLKTQLQKDGFDSVIDQIEKVDNTNMSFIL